MSPTAAATSGPIAGRDAEETILTLAGSQHGVVSRAQLLAAGIPPDQVDRRVGGSRLRPLQRGVYLVGPLTVPLARPMSAVLACGGAAVVAHRSAAVLWPLMPAGDAMTANGATGSGGARPIDVIIPTGVRRRRPGVRVHRTDLRPDEVTTLDALPITTPTRTLYDLAGSMAERELERAIAEALARRLTDNEQLEGMVNRYAGRRAATRLRALLDSGQPPALTRSAAEEAFLALIRRAQLPPPAVNVRVKGYEVDFYWRAARLVTEMDGFAFHASRRKFEDDRRRDAVLAAAGVRVMRVTWRQLEKEPEAVATRLARALGPSD